MITDKSVKDLDRKRNGLLHLIRKLTRKELKLKI